MNIHKVAEPPGFVAVCLTCGQAIPAGTLKYADLDGPAFKAYYHSTCLPEQTERRRPTAIHRTAADTISLQQAWAEKQARRKEGAA